MTDEPKGTRMQVVKGFSDLTFNFLDKQLGEPMEKPPHCKYYRPRRHQLVCHSPKWEGDHWVCSYVLDVNEEKPHIPPLAILELAPNGRFVLTLYDRNGRQRLDYVGTLRPEGAHKDEQVRAYYCEFAAGKYGKILAEHLVEQTKPVPGVKIPLL